MKNFKRVLAILLCLVMVFSMVACGEKGEGGETKDDTVYHIATGALGAYNYTLYAGISDKINKAYSNKYEISLDCASGSTEMGRMCALGDAQFGTCTMDDLWNCFNGTAEYDGCPSGEIAFLYNTGGTGPTCHLVTPKNSAINSVYDLVGKKIGIPAGYYQKYFKYMMQVLGINDDQYTINTLAINDIVNGIKDETIDAGFYSAPHPLNNFVDLASTTGCKFVDFGREVVDKVLAAYPFMHEVVMPAGTYEGQTADITSFTAYTCWICRKDVPEEVVYEWLKVILADDAHLEEIHPNAKNIKRDTALEGRIIPLHAGALKYYKEYGLIDKDELADLKPEK